MPGDAPNPQPAEVQELIRQLRLASARAIRIIRNPPGKSERSKSFASSAAAQQLAQFDRELKVLEARAVNVASKTVRRAYETGLKNAEKMARDIGVADGPIKASFSHVDTRRALVLVRTTADDIGNAVRSIGQTTRRVVKATHALGLDAKEVDRLMAGETLSGRAPQALRELRKMTRAAAIDGKLITVNPRTGEERQFKPDFYADLVFQTKLAEATNIATLERLREKKIAYVRIIGSDSTNFCTAFVGKVYYIGEGKDPGGDYPNITELPRGGAPFHPRCTKRYVAFVPGLATQKQKDEGKPTPETEKLHGESVADAQRKFESDSPANSVTKSKVPGDDNIQKARLSPRRSDEPQESPLPRPLALRGDAGSPGPSDVDISDVKLSIRNSEQKAMAESAVRRALAKGYKIPSVVRDGPEHFDPAEHDVNPAGYIAETEEIVVNTSYRHWPNFQELLSLRARQGRISSDDPDYVIFHEIAHHMVKANLGLDEYRRLGSSRLLAEEVPFAESVSQYAATEPLEFVAEVFPLIMSGRQVSKAVLRIYYKYGGL